MGICEQFAHKGAGETERGQNWQGARRAIACRACSAGQRRTWEGLQGCAIQEAGVAVRTAQVGRGKSTGEGSRHRYFEVKKRYLLGAWGSGKARLCRGHVCGRQAGRAKLS